jgi:hypothetical protein
MVSQERGMGRSRTSTSSVRGRLAHATPSSWRSRRRRASLELRKLAAQVRIRQEGVHAPDCSPFRPQRITTPRSAIVRRACVSVLCEVLEPQLLDHERSRSCKLSSRGSPLLSCFWKALASCVCSQVIPVRLLLPAHRLPRALHAPPTRAPPPRAPSGIAHAPVATSPQIARASLDPCPPARLGLPGRTPF